MAQIIPGAQQQAPGSWQPRDAAAAAAAGLLTLLAAPAGLPPPRLQRPTCCPGCPATPSPWSPCASSMSRGSAAPAQVRSRLCGTAAVLCAAASAPCRRPGSTPASPRASCSDLGQGRRRSSAAACCCSRCLAVCLLVPRALRMLVPGRCGRCEPVCAAACLPVPPPGAVLKRVLAGAFQERGLTFQMGFELEFYLLRLPKEGEGGGSGGGGGLPPPLDTSNYCHSGSFDAAAPGAWRCVGVWVCGWMLLGCVGVQVGRGRYYPWGRGGTPEEAQPVCLGRPPTRPPTDEDLTSGQRHACRHACLPTVLTTSHAVQPTTRPHGLACHPLPWPALLPRSAV